MSQVKVKKPIIHIPSFKEYGTTRRTIQDKLEALGLVMPMGMLDRIYYYTNLEGWGKVLYDLVFNSSLYKADKFDCDDFALKAKSVCAERYGLNTLGFVIGDIPTGRHAFNILYYGEGFMLWEPNDGFPCSGEAFEIGENGYQPELILI